MPHRLVLPIGAVRLLRGLLDELVDLHLDPEETGRARNPAWERLYPSTTADPRLDRDLRDLVHPDLVEGRREAFELVADALDGGVRSGDGDTTADEADAVRVGLGAVTEVLSLDDEQATAMLGVVNDIRLALAATVDLAGLLDDEGDRLRDDVTEEARGVVELVEWLAVVQEQVLASLAPLSQAHFDDPVHDRGRPAPSDDDPDHPDD